MATYVRRLIREWELGGGNVPLVLGIDDACDTEKISKRNDRRNGDLLLS